MTRNDSTERVLNQRLYVAISVLRESSTASVSNSDQEDEVNELSSNSELSLLPAKFAVPGLLADVSLTSLRIYDIIIASWLESSRQCLTVSLDMLLSSLIY